MLSYDEAQQYWAGCCLSMTGAINLLPVVSAGSIEQLTIDVQGYTPFSSTS